MGTTHSKGKENKPVANDRRTQEGEAHEATVPLGEPGAGGAIGVLAVLLLQLLWM